MSKMMDFIEFTSNAAFFPQLLRFPNGFNNQWNIKTHQHSLEFTKHDSSVSLYWLKKLPMYQITPLILKLKVKKKICQLGRKSTEHQFWKEGLFPKCCIFFLLLKEPSSFFLSWIKNTEEAEGTDETRTVRHLITALALP